MYSLSIFFGPSPVPAQFLFKEKTKVETAIIATKTENSHFEISDEFGQWGNFKTEDVHAIIVEDMDLGEESRILRGLSQARGQAKANERARIDPMLRTAMGGQGPSVLTPFGRNGFNG